MLIDCLLYIYRSQYTISREYQRNYWSTRLVLIITDYHL